MRRGFDPESVVGRFVNHVSSIAEKIKDTWQYLTDYEGYCEKQAKKEALQEKVTLRKHKNVVQDYQYAHREVGRRYSQMHKENETMKVDKDLKDLLTVRNKLAQEIVNNKSIYQSSIEMLNIDEKSLNKAAEFKEKTPEKEAIPEKIDWDQLEGISHRHIDSMKRLEERMNKTTGSRRGALTDTYFDKMEQLLSNKKIMAQIKQRAPKIAQHMKIKVMEINKDKGRDR